MQLNVPDPETIESLSIRFRSRASLAGEIGSQINRSFVQSGWSSPEQVRFASHVSLIVRNFNAVEEQLNQCAAAAGRLATEYASLLHWLERVETQVRGWIEDAASELVAVEHLVHDVFSSCESLLGISYSNLPPTYSPQWQTIYSRACAQGFVLQ
jgi:hypothetical protein